MKILIDAGHNYEGADTGAAGNGLREQDITYQIAAALKPMLEQNGQEVRLTRNAVTESLSNQSVNASLSARTRMANEWPADLFVSIHCNAGGGTGTETYCYEGGISSGFRLAQAVQKQLVAQTGLPDRGVKTGASLYVLRHTAMPAILVETAFIDHAQDAAVLKSKAGQHSMALGIAKGICAYLNIPFREEEDKTVTQEYAAVREELDNLTETVKILAVEVNALRHPMIYDYIDENMPQWARPTIQKLCEKGFLKGDEGGLNLDETLLRLLVINDRAGVYGE